MKIKISSNLNNLVKSNEHINFWLKDKITLQYKSKQLKYNYININFLFICCQKYKMYIER